MEEEFVPRNEYFMAISILLLLLMKRNVEQITKKWWMSFNRKFF